ncbi:MAG TPA: hypothetical protein VNB87_02325, partial [Propionibacteriaceae bacterium]|nr:hypothetical protein [Propionibacteriaceae bacterium]
MTDGSDGGLIHARASGQPDDRRAEDAVRRLDGGGNGSAGPAEHLSSSPRNDYREFRRLVGAAGLRR